MTPNKVLYAHSLTDRPEKEWRMQDEHLATCARLTGDFAAVFCSDPWSKSLGGKPLRSKMTGKQESNSPN